MAENFTSFPLNYNKIDILFHLTRQWQLYYHLIKSSELATFQLVCFITFKMSAFILVVMAAIIQGMPGQGSLVSIRYQPKSIL